MIPKQLFFIWIGDNKPNYVNFAVNSFKEANPDFKVDLLEYTVANIENKDNVSKYDHNVYNCLDYIINNTNNPYSFTIKEYKSYKRKVVQILANILRLDLLNEYGGIYLDCDTFPCKSFDDNILLKKDFCSYTFTSYDKEHRHRDCNFLGKQKNNDILKSYYGYWDVENVNPYNHYNNNEWLYKRQLFYNCDLKYIPQNTEYYINHFIDRTWNPQNCRTPICKYDT